MDFEMMANLTARVGRTIRFWLSVVVLLACSANLDATQTEQKDPGLNQTNQATQSTPTAPPQKVVRFGFGDSKPIESNSDQSTDSLTTPNTNPLRFTDQEPAVPLSPANQVDEQEDGVVELTKFDGESAYGYLRDICDIGPRPSASPGMRKQQKYIQDHFEAIGGSFHTQPFRVVSPISGRQVDLQNLMIRWHPERVKRLLICCHHDTRPFADADPRNPRAKFIGANDGGSGVALLCELGKHMGAMPGEYGVDFLFFDGEEFVIVRQRDQMFLGSQWFARSYANGKIEWTYEQAVLVDMVGDKDLQIYMEKNSLKFAEQLTKEIWTVADKIGVKEFIPQEGKFIKDDHLPLNEIAKIPTVDIIDFDFPNPTAGNVFWHTREDKLENCSAESLGKVGSVVLAWLRQKQGQ